MTTIHWVHAGPDALFGLNHLQGCDATVRVWTREGRLAGIPAEMQHPMDMEQLWEAVHPGDIILAPRPTDLAVARLLSSRKAKAVTTMMGVAGRPAAASRRRISSITVNPSMSGSWMSMITASNREASSRSRAWAPVWA